MPAQYDPKAYTGARTGIYRLTARHFFGTLYFLYNRLTVEGRENLPEGPFVAVGNHLSNADPPLLSVATDRPIAFLAKKELYAVPVLKELILFYGAISVDRKNPEISTFKAVKEMFKAGWCLGMFIEGTRSKTPGTLGQPHQGPAYFARSNKVPLVPIGIVGTNKPWGKAYARIGKPIEATGDLEVTTWKVMEELAALTGLKLPPREPAATNSS